MAKPISPLAPASFAELPPICGVSMVGVNCGIRYQKRKDLMIMRFAHDASVAGVFTKSKTAAAPVIACKQHLAGGVARALIVNSGNANAFTGKFGQQAVVACLTSLAAAIGCEPEECFMSSTGVIGEALPYEKILASLPTAIKQLAEDNWFAAAEAIMTTDSFPKLATRKVSLPGGEVTINGIAKGSGMIAPDMATMLAYIVTDADIDSAVLQQMLQEANATSFNAITVDSDTSTSDTVLLFATRNKQINLDDADEYKLFYDALYDLMLDLAKQIVMDGEGASKFFEVIVEGAASDESAKIVAMAIANSPLVKTAIAGEDANWGRVVMAVGKAGQPADRDKLQIWFGDNLVAANGQRHPEYTEEIGAAYMRNSHLRIRVDLGVGNGAFTAYSCDFTEGYIRINADYRS